MSDAEEEEPRTARVEVVVDEERGVYMISVAAELADMHPQTLRIYESKGLIQPKRSPKNTRLYSQRDVEMLRRIQQMTSEGGLNLAGVMTVLEMEAKVDAMRAELEEMRARASELEQRLDREVERVRDKLNTEIVPYGAYEGAISANRPETVRIPVKRPR
ncbi:MAG TPA: helix-turn-helix transcriptional regulator [Solirubrobacterales bacterium]|nr:helix-turn-helix transcriptional regulator [Solirubrobacterales bacterium]